MATFRLYAAKPLGQSENYLTLDTSEGDMLHGLVFTGIDKALEDLALTIVTDGIGPSDPRIIMGRSEIESRDFLETVYENRKGVVGARMGYSIGPANLQRFGQLLVEYSKKRANPAPYTPSG